MITMPTGAQAQTVFELVEENYETSILEALLVATGLDQPLRGSGPITVFAPSDEAFGIFFDSDPELAGAIQMDLSSWMTHVMDLLLFHAAPGRNLIQTQPTGATITVSTLNGGELTIDVLSNGFRARPAVGGGYSQGLASISVTNGDANLMNAVLAPSWLTQSIVDVTGSDPQFSTLVGLLTRMGIEDMLRSLSTMFGITVRICACSMHANHNFARKQLTMTILHLS